MNRGLAMKFQDYPRTITACEPYLREVHTRIIGDVMVTGSVAGDSTGSNRFVRWFSIRHKRGWVKLHSIADAEPS